MHLGRRLVVKPWLNTPSKASSPPANGCQCVISGIVFVLTHGIAYRTSPAVYSLRTTVSNRFHRWAQRGIWDRIQIDLLHVVSKNFLVEKTGPAGTHMDDVVTVDSTVIRALHLGAPRGGVWVAHGQTDPKRQVTTNGAGLLLRLVLKPGQAHDAPVRATLLTDLKIGSERVRGQRFRWTPRGSA